MRDLLYNVYSNFERSTYKVAVLVCYAAFFMCLRVLLETMSTGLFMRSDKVLVAMVSIEYLLWYISTYLILLACFRYIARVPLSRAVYVLLSTVILLEPVFAASLAGAKAQFSFLSYNDPDLFKSIVSLMYFNAANHHMFYELLLMAIDVPLIAYFFCRSVVRSILTWVCAYLSIIFLNFFVYFCSVAICAFVVDSDIPISIFLCFYAIVFAGACICLFLFPELRRYWYADNTIFTQASAFWALLFFIPYGIVGMLMSGYFFDLLFLFASYVIFFYVSLFLYKHWKEKSLLGLNTFLAIYGGLILTTFVLTAFRFFS